MQNKYQKILVTGASGQLGRKLTRRLVDLGFDVRAHFRSHDKAEKWLPDGAEAVYGDLLMPEWLYEACDDRDLVIHCAAWVSLGPRNYDMMYQINVNGTRSVIDACRQTGVKKLIHISSTGAVGATNNGVLLDESTIFNLYDVGIPYFETKHLAEIEALKANGRDFEVVILNPTMMISPADRKLTRGDLDRIPKQLPFYFNFGISVVDTDDVIDAVISSIEKGRGGERYILSGDNIDADKAFELADKYIHLKKPAVKLPYFLLYSTAGLIELMTKLRIPIRFKVNGWNLNRKIARLTRVKFFYNSDKARRELDFNPRPVEESIERILESVDLN